MLETITTLCRTLASEPRLRILYVLTREQELHASEIATRARLSASGVSCHVRRLVSTGLLARRRSGARVFCQVPGRGHDGIGAQTADLVCRACRDVGWGTSGWDEGTLIHLSPSMSEQTGLPVARALDVLFDAATSFGNVRRLQLVRLLAQQGPCLEGQIVAQLKMSSIACRRHIDKLSRRGVVHRQGGDGWRLSKSQRTPVHAALAKLVLRWLDRPLRSFETP